MLKESGASGNFQTQIMILIILAIMIAFVILLALPYLLLYPNYLCYSQNSDGSESLMTGYDCVPANFCGDPNIRAERAAGKTSLNNWILDFNLVCAGPQVIIGFYLLVFAGIAVGAIFIAPLTDSWGKKNILIIALLTLMILFVMIMMASTYERVYYYMLFYGICLAVIVVAGLLFMMHMIPKNKWPLVLLITLISVATVSLYITIYFYFLSQNWRPLIQVSVVALLVLVIFVWFVSETLRFLYDEERYDELDEGL